MEKREAILEIITGLFRQELSEPSLVLTFASSANDVEKWDSINNLILLTAIEDRFKVVFPIDFILKADNVGDLCDFVINNSTAI